jgi:hypothetical protein
MMLHVKAKALLKKAWFYEKKADPNDPRTKQGLDETKQAIREFRQHYAETDQRAAQRNQSQTGRGESGEREEAEG